MAARRARGWSSTYPSRVKATHYVGDDGKSRCRRARIKIIESDLGAMPQALRRLLRGAPLCDWCVMALR